MVKRGCVSGPRSRPFDATGVSPSVHPNTKTNEILLNTQLSEESYGGGGMFERAWGMPRALGFAARAS